MTATTTSQRAKILDLLKARGTVSNVELNKIAFRYSARLYELRQEGHRITTRPIRDGIVHYTYLGRAPYLGQGLYGKPVK